VGFACAIVDVNTMQTPSKNNFLSAILLDIPWKQVIGYLWTTGKDLLSRLRGQGLYEVLEYESTLDLKGIGGKRAAFRKRQKVRYLQDNIIAYQDQAWGDGKILLNYRCTPGKPVDRYRSGYKTQNLISLREVKKRGDIDEFNIQWGIRDGFLRQTEQWETDISHRTKRMIVNVIFPKARPPLRASIIERSHQREVSLGKKKRLPDGRWLVSWSKNAPRLHEQYVLQWEW
jgi:hypothetical protein